MHWGEISALAAIGVFLQGPIWWIALSVSRWVKRTDHRISVLEEYHLSDHRHFQAGGDEEDDAP